MFTLLAMRNRTATEQIAEQANFLNLTHDSIFARDARNAITYWNRGSETLYGWSSEEAVGKLAGAIAQAFPEKSGKARAAAKPLLAIPFRSAADAAQSKKIADTVFAELYGRIAISHHGMVGLAPLVSESLDDESVVRVGQNQHSKYVLYGVVNGQPSAATLDVRVLEVDDGSVAWSGSFPVMGANPTEIAEEVESKLPDLDDD